MKLLSHTNCYFNWTLYSLFWFPLFLSNCFYQISSYIFQSQFSGVRGFCHHKFQENQLEPNPYQLKKRWDTSKPNLFSNLLCETLQSRYCTLVIFRFHLFMKFSTSVSNQCSLLHNREYNVNGTWFLISICEYLIM